MFCNSTFDTCSCQHFAELANSYFPRCSTTRENKVWEGVQENDMHSFLPISPTPEQAGRRALILETDAENVFVGRSLLFLAVEKEVHPNFLGDYIGAITSESLQFLKSERQKWTSLSTDRNHRSYNSQASAYSSRYRDSAAGF